MKFCIFFIFVIFCHSICLSTELFPLERLKKSEELKEKEPHALLITLNYYYYLAVFISLTFYCKMRVLDVTFFLSLHLIKIKCV